MIIDIHAHLDLLEKNTLQRVIQNSEKKVKAIITNSINLESCKKNLEISKQFPKVLFAAGLYPEENLILNDFKKFQKFVEENKKEIVALGEIGLDLFHTEKNFDTQIQIFKKQLDLAKKLNLPVIIHTRKAEREVLDILKEYPELKKILHCFSGNFKLIKEANEMGCYFSIPTNIVFSEHFQKMAKELPKEKILTETDTPYLSPYKGIKNEPAFIKETITLISKIWKIPEKEVEKQIEQNFKKIFSKNEKKFSD